jgi:hypothetical protein
LVAGVTQAIIDWVGLRHHCTRVSLIFLLELLLLFIGDSFPFEVRTHFRECAELNDVSRVVIQHLLLK